MPRRRTRPRAIEPQHFSSPVGIALAGTRPEPLLPLPHPLPSPPIALPPFASLCLAGPLVAPAALLHPHHPHHPHHHLHPHHMHALHPQQLFQPQVIVIDEEEEQQQQRGGGHRAHVVTSSDSEPGPGLEREHEEFSQDSRAQESEEEEAEVNDKHHSNYGRAKRRVKMKMVMKGKEIEPNTEESEGRDEDEEEEEDDAAKADDEGDGLYIERRRNKRKGHSGSDEDAEIVVRPKRKLRQRRVQKQESGGIKPKRLKRSQKVQEDSSSSASTSPTRSPQRTVRPKHSMGVAPEDPEVCCPFVKLPPEMVLQVFAHFDEKNRYRQLVTCALVCRHWYHIANVDMLWRTLDIEEYPDMTDTQLRTLCTRRTNIKSLKLQSSQWEEDAGSFTDNKIASILRLAGSSLKHLELGFVKPVVFRRIAKSCHNLRSLHIRGCQSTVTQSSLVFADVLENCTELRELYLGAWSHKDWAGFVPKLYHIPHIEKLSICDKYISDEKVIADIIQRHWSKTLTKLELFTSWYSFSSTDGSVINCIKLVLGGCPNLRELVLSPHHFYELLLDLEKNESRSDGSESQSGSATGSGSTSTQGAKGKLASFQNLLQGNTQFLMPAGSDASTVSESEEEESDLDSDGDSPGVLCDQELVVLPRVGPVYDNLHVLRSASYEDFIHYGKFNISSSFYRSIAQFFPSLRKLELASSSFGPSCGMTDRDLITVLKGCRMLEELIIFASPKMSTKGIRGVIKYGKNLRVLWFCRKIALGGSKFNILTLDRQDTAIQGLVAGWMGIDIDPPITMKLFQKLLEETQLVDIQLAGVPCLLSGKRASAKLFCNPSNCKNLRKEEEEKRRRNSAATASATTTTRQEPTYGDVQQRARQYMHQMLQQQQLAQLRLEIERRSNRGGPAGLGTADPEVVFVEERPISSMGGLSASWHGFTHHASFTNTTLRNQFLSLDAAIEAFCPPAVAASIVATRLRNQQAQAEDEEIDVDAVVPLSHSDRDHTTRRDEDDCRNGVKLRELMEDQIAPNSIVPGTVVQREKRVKRVPCPTCGLRKYCSVECQKADWNSGHQKECRGWRLAKVLRARKVTDLQLSRVNLRSFCVLSEFLEQLTLTYGRFYSIRLSCPNLKSLALLQNENLTAVVGDKMPQLEEFYLSHSPKIKSLELTSTRLEKLIVRSCGNLQHLRLESKQIKYLAVPASRLTTIHGNADFAKLRVFIANNSSALNLSFLPGNELNASELTYLDLSENKTIQDLIVNCPKLKTLLCDNSAANDEMLNKLGRSPSLVRVTLDATQVTGKGICSLLRKAPALRELDIRFCDNIRIEDVLAIAGVVIKRNESFRWLRVSGCLHLEANAVRQAMAEQFPRFKSKISFAPP